MKQQQSKTVGLCSIILIALLYAPNYSPAMAQVSASILGKIEDASGAAIPGAIVTATSLETGAARTVSADEAGNYRWQVPTVPEMGIRIFPTGPR